METNFIYSEDSEYGNVRDIPAHDIIMRPVVFYLGKTRLFYEAEDFRVRLPDHKKYDYGSDYPAWSRGIQHFSNGVRAERFAPCSLSLKLSEKQVVDRPSGGHVAFGTFFTDQDGHVVVKVFDGNMLDLTTGKVTTLPANTIGYRKAVATVLRLSWEQAGEVYL